MAEGDFPSDLNYARHGWWQTFAVVSAVVYGLLLTAFLARCVLHPRKVVKEWHCPTRSNGFVLLFAPLVEFAFLIYDVDSGDRVRFARGLWWLGAVPIAALTALKIGEWIGRSLTVEHVTPAWVLTPAANLLAAAGAETKRKPAGRLGYDAGTVATRRTPGRPGGCGGPRRSRSSLR